jgi:hypothetical protein
MKKYFIFHCLLLAQMTTAQTFQGVQTLKGNHQEYIKKVVFTPKNERIVAGYYDWDEPVSFSSCGGKTVELRGVQDSLAMNDSRSALFVAKYSDKNCLLWVATAFAEKGIYTWDVATDNMGNSIVCGNFRGKAFFYSADKKNKKVVQGSNYPYWNDTNPYNYFIAKYDTNGRLLWVKVGVSNQNAAPFQVLMDSEDNIFLRVYCLGNNISSDKYTLLPSNPRELPNTYLESYHIIVIKYAPNGEEEWITYGGHKSGTINPKNMYLNAFGHIVLEEYVRGERLYFFNTSGSKQEYLTPEIGIYRIELDKKGEMLHCLFLKNLENKAVKTITTPAGVTYMAMKVDNSNLDKPFLEWHGTHFSKGYEDIFLAKINKNGDKEWLIHIGGQYDEMPFDMIFDKKGNVLLSGRYDLEVDIKGISGKTQHLTNKMRGLFIASFTPDGALNWAENCGTIFYNGQLTHPTLQLIVNAKNQLFLYGLINMPSQFGKYNVDITGGLDQNYAVSQNPLRHETYNFPDAFIAQYDLGILEEQEKPAITGPPVASLSENTSQNASNSELNKDNSALLYPNPVGQDIGIVNALLTLATDNAISWRLYDATGRLLVDETEQVKRGTVHKQFSLKNRAAGIYFLRITIGKDLITKQIVLL